MRPLIAGNWKMNGLAPQLGEIEAIAASAKAKPPLADILICPPATLIARAAQTAAGRIAIGGEDCHTEIAGAFTGDVSAEMLKDAGASAVIGTIRCPMASGAGILESARSLPTRIQCPGQQAMRSAVAGRDRDGTAA
jgi:hypothetical protein